MALRRKLSERDLRVPVGPRALPVSKDIVLSSGVNRAFVYQPGFTAEGLIAATKAHFKGAAVELPAEGALRRLRSTHQVGGITVYITTVPQADTTQIALPAEVL